MDTLIPELDRICPECGCPYVACVTTTAEKWLGHCPQCGWQGWQQLPTYSPPPANQSRPPAKSPRVQIAHDPKRTPISHRLSPTAGKRNLPLGAHFPDDAPRRRYGYHGISDQPLRPWPRWCGVVAPIVFTVVMLAVVWLEVLHPGALSNFEPFPEPAVQWDGPVPTFAPDCWYYDGHYQCPKSATP